MFINKKTIRLMVSMIFLIIFLIAHNGHIFMGDISYVVYTGQGQ